MAFLRSLTARGLSGVRLVISDAHRVLFSAIGAALLGAGWPTGRPRSRSHRTGVRTTNAQLDIRRRFCIAEEIDELDRCRLSVGADTSSPRRQVRIPRLAYRTGWERRSGDIVLGKLTHEIIVEAAARAHMSFLAVRR
jgi:hypothetical protein